METTTFFANMAFGKPLKYEDENYKCLLKTRDTMAFILDFKLKSKHLMRTKIEKENLYNETLFAFNNQN